MPYRSSTLILTTGVWLLLAGALLAQKPRIISEEWRSESTPGRELLAPFDRFEDLQSWDSGFENAGRRHSVVLPGDRRRLEYVLSNLGADAVDSLKDFGRLGFRERWLVCHLQRRLPDLERVDVVDNVVSRTSGDATTASLERRLEIIGRSEDVALAENYLDEVIRQNRGQVLVEVHMYQRRIESAGNDTTVTVTALDRAALENRLTRCKSKKGSSLITAPKLTVLGAQSAFVTCVNQISYIRTYETHAVDDEVVVNPIVDVLHDGIVIHTTPIIGSEGKTISLGMDIGLAHVKRPIETSKVVVPPNDVEISVQLPEVDVVNWSSEDLMLLEGEHGFHVTGLRMNDWTDEGERMGFELELLVSLDIIDLAAVRVSLSLPIAVVLGYDPNTCLVFTRLGDSGARGLDSGQPVEFRRGDVVVGSGKISDLLGDVLVIALENGEVRPADDVYLAR